MAAVNMPQYPEWLPGIEVDHVNAAIEHLKSVFPEAAINPSSIEATLLEAFAVLLGPVTYAYQRVPTSIVEHFMGLYGLYRHSGRVAVGRVQFRVSSGAEAVTIPRHTVLRHFLSEHAGTLEFRTSESITVLPSESVVGEAWMEATETGISHNGLTKGARLEVVGYFMHLEGAQVAMTTRNGLDPEDDDSFEERSMALLARQTQALVYADQFGAAALTDPDVGRVSVLDNFVKGVGYRAGNVTVAVTDVSGQPLPEEKQASLQAWLRGQSLASLLVHVIAPEYTTINLDVVVEAKPGTDHAQVENAVIDELTRRLNPLTWDWWENVTAYDIASWVDDVPGVARVVHVPVNGAQLAGVAPLPLPGLFSVTVNEPTR